MSSNDAIEQARLSIDSLRGEGFSLEELAALFGVTRPIATKYTYHPELMTLQEFQYLERFYSDYQLKRSMLNITNGEEK